MSVAVTESKRYPHRRRFYEVSDIATHICGDLVLVPDANNLDGLKREDLTKINHWSNMEPADVPRLAVLTDSFFRFIDEGQDASVITLWRDGTPIIQQIEGECEAAVDAVMDAVTDMKPLKEKWVGLPPLAAEIERIAYKRRLASGNRPAELEGEARRRLAARDIDPAAPVASNDNRPADVRLLEAFGDGNGKMCFDGDTRTYYLAGCWKDGVIGNAMIDTAGEVYFEPHTHQPPPPVHATPFVLRDPASLPAREWLYGRHYIRRYLTSTVGAGGGGKSAHAISEALAMATGLPLLDPDGALTKPLRIWYVNAEDPQDEIDRRFHAAAKHFGITAEQIGDRLFTDSGRNQSFVVMKQDGRGFAVCQPLIDQMVAEIQRRQIDVVIIDPLVSTHEVPENDNSAMQRVARAWTEVADRGNCCIEVVHHVVKNGAEVTADSARGGGALKDKTRSMRVLNPMTDAEAAKVNLSGPDGYFRIDLGKFNMTARGHSAWRRFVSVPLGNGTGILSAGDQIGVVEPWRWPSKDALAERQAEARRAVVADVPAETLAGLKVRLANSDYKESQQAKNWAGHLVAELVGLDSQADRDQIKAMLAAWIADGELEIVDLPDAYRHMKPHIKPAAAPSAAP